MGYNYFLVTAGRLSCARTELWFELGLELEYRPSLARETLPKHVRHIMRIMCKDTPMHTSRHASSLHPTADAPLTMEQQFCVSLCAKGRPCAMHNKHVRPCIVPTDYVSEIGLYMGIRARCAIELSL
eukprot:8404385-Pyramimonas_sp.AAC.1